MSNVGYDLDTSGGLMPLIRALIKPPDEDLNAPKPKKPQHPYYKRPGKGHNHDSCDACGEGGDLICCDRCPASFHLGCYDPPLEENDIPAGLWLCKECRASDDKPASSRSSRAQSPADNKSDTDKRTRSLRNSRANSVTKKKGKEDNKGKEEEDAKKESEPEKELSPMEVLVKAAKVMNPKQFELPREMRVPCIFPGTEKEGGAAEAGGCGPPPARACALCSGSCRPAPLLQCDYCPLLFHQDCLEPPLTALPTGRWMCPNHVEQYIDWKLVRSVSLSERVALWERFTAPVDQHALKVDFIRRARTRAPPFRVKVPVGMRGRVIVPRMVRYHYRRPPPLLPSRRDHVRCSALARHSRHSDTDDSDRSDRSDRCDRSDRRLVCLDLDCPQAAGGECRAAARGPRPLRHRDGGAADGDGAGGGAGGAGGGAADGADGADGHDHDVKVKQRAASEGRAESESSELSDSDLEQLTREVTRRKVAPAEVKVKKGEGRLQLRGGEGVQQLLETAQLQLDKLDDSLVKLLAWQRLQQVAAGEATGGRWRRAALGGWGVRAARALRGACRTRLARLGVRQAPLPSELLARADRDRIAATVWGPAPAAPPDPLPPPAVELADALVRAALCEVKQTPDGVGAMGAAVAMRGACLRVGVGPACDVTLSARCRRVSLTHALIFCDEVTRHFELINYSEWGTVVNGVMYACDLSRQTSDGAEARSPEEARVGEARPEEVPDTEARAQALREVVRARQRKPPRINGSLTKPLEAETECRCPPRGPPSAAAWEGSALLQHGALLQFGCRHYVFSVADPEPDPAPAL